MADKRYQDEEWLRRKYHQEKLSTVEIAEVCGVDDSTIYRWIERHGIEKREFDPQERTKAAREAATEKYGEGGALAEMWEKRTDEMIKHAKAAAPLGAPARDKNGMAGVTGEDNPMGGVTGEDHHMHGKTGKDHPSHGKTGSDHHAWRGGKSIYDAVKKCLGNDSWNTIRRRARKSTDDGCEMCGTSPDEQGLDVHHIIPLLAGGDHGSYNLMVLCRSCHIKVEHATRDIFEPVLTA